MDENTRLALVRTLLAAERNYLALERTQLSQLRTGLSIAVIAPSVAATLTYVSSYFQETPQYEGVVLFLLMILTVYGIFMALSSYNKLRKTHKIQKLIRKKEIKIINETGVTKSYFEEIFTLNDK